MRVAFYSEPFHPLLGGMERFAEDIATGLSGLGIEVTLITTTSGAGDDGERFPFSVVRSSRFPEKVTAFHSADVVLLSGLTITGFTAALLARRPFLVVHHGAYRSPGSLRSAVTGGLKRLACRFTTNVSVSRALAREIGGRHMVIGNPYRDDVYRDLGLARRPNSFILCGRLVSEKGYDLAVAALAAVRDRRPDSTLTIVGSGPEQDALAALAARMGVSDAVAFAGPLPPEQLVKAYNRHVCSVIPSLCKESFGIVALEAGACGCELIVSDRGGLAEAAGPSARVVEPSVERLADAMLEASGGRERADRDECRKHLARHRREHVALRYARVLQTVRAGR